MEPNEIKRNMHLPLESDTDIEVITFYMEVGDDKYLSLNKYGNIKNAAAIYILL